MAENQQKQFICTGKCIECPVWQRNYCACKHAYETMRMVQSIEETVNAMYCSIEEMKTKIAAIQDSEAMVFDPHQEQEDVETSQMPLPDITQEGAGV